MLKPSAVLDEQRVDQGPTLDDHERIVALEEKVARLEALLAGAAALTLGLLPEPELQLRL